MILLFDVGNTSIKIGLAENNQIKKVYRINTVSNKTPDLYAVDLNNLFEPNQIKAVVIGSVVPEVTLTLKILAKRLYHVEPIVIEPGVKTGIRLQTDYPQEVGADIIAACAAINDPRPTVIVDLGTANKYIYTKDKTLLGVIISPGIANSMKALVDSTALLPNIDIKVPKKVLGTNTIMCMQSGVTYGVAAEVEGLLMRIKGEIREDPHVIITGGLAKIIAPLIYNNLEVNPNLVLEGLLNIYHLNVK
ncbi:MAG: type III pantothenate kinase [Acholeplasmataceae bacterium]|nr:type III pantothenate kinase [Acholeplasmataceae bacterium]